VVENLPDGWSLNKRRPSAYEARAVEDEARQ